jgi:hypothetical protein
METTVLPFLNGLVEERERFDPHVRTISASKVDA